MKNKKEKKKSKKDKPKAQLLLLPHKAKPVTVFEEKLTPLSLNQQRDQTNNPSLPQTKNMELSHHSHSHHPRKFTDYLFEFLMLFLAVVAGFFVENQREHYIENQRARQFSKQLLIDLRADSALFENRIKSIQSMQKGYDSLNYLLTEKTNSTDKEILEVLLPISYAYDIPAITSTYNQMKSSGSLRYIENPELVTHLQTYYDGLLPRSIKITDASLSYYSQHINTFYLNHIRTQDIDMFNDTLKNKNPVIIGRTNETNQQLANIMGGYRSLLTIQLVTMNEPALKKIKETLEALKKEYELN